MTTYGERRDALTRFQVTLKTTRDQMAQVLLMLTAAKGQLDALPTQLKLLIEDINTDKSQGEIAYQVMASEAMVMLNEMSVLSQQLDAEVKAIQSLPLS